ncbi:MAG: hypothetical protein ABSE87_11970 [Terracidiphilus sp.]|jgi:hypothetical protein
MDRSKTLPIVLVFAAITAVCVPANAQTDQDVSAPQPTPARVRKAEQRPLPFPPGVERQDRASSIEFRSYDRMTQHDRDLAADAESSIGEHAGVEGLEFNQGKWNYQQIVCPALPSHLFLQFTRNNGTGDVSVFSASIPRGGDGRVRIIPILRRGYSLFSPAPINALTISAFNHIRAEEPANSPDWVTTGLCYAALAGAHPQMEPAEETDFRKLPAAPPALLVIPLRGGAVIRFTDIAAIPHPMLWTMTFDGKGKLLKASHSAAAQHLKEKTVPGSPFEVQGKPVQAADPTANAILIK